MEQHKVLWVTSALHISRCISECLRASHSITIHLASNYSDNAFPLSGKESEKPTTMHHCWSSFHIHPSRSNAFYPLKSIFSMSWDCGYCITISSSHSLQEVLSWTKHDKTPSNEVFSERVEQRALVLQRSSRAHSIRTHTTWQQSKHCLHEQQSDRNSKMRELRNLLHPNEPLQQ